MLFRIVVLLSECFRHVVGTGVGPRPFEHYDAICFLMNAGMDPPLEIPKLSSQHSMSGLHSVSLVADGIGNTGTDSLKKHPLCTKVVD